MGTYDDFLLAVHEERAARDSEGVVYGQVFMDLLRKQNPDAAAALSALVICGELDVQSFKVDSLPPEIHHICEQLF